MIFRIRDLWLGVLATNIFILMGCGDGQNLNIREYYFPTEELKEIPLVYEYQPVNNDTLGSEYWYFQTVQTDTAIYFTGNYYDRNFEVGQFSSEEVVDNGTIQKDYFLFIFDTSGYQQQVPAEVEIGNVFPFEVSDSTEIYLQKMRWTFSEEPLRATTLTRVRRYKGKTTYEHKGRNYDCVEFQVNELLDDFNNGHLEKEYQGKEIYAKGLGLVYYKKDIEGLILEYELIDTYPMDTLEKKYQQVLNEQQ